jgi:hypothetical protein
LVRRDRPGREAAPYLALSLVALAGIVAGLLLALRRRQWHVVTLTLGPDDAIITHQMHARRPPQEEI